MVCQEKDKVSSTMLNYRRNELFKHFWEDGRGMLGMHGNGYIGTKPIPSLNLDRSFPALRVIT